MTRTMAALAAALLALPVASALAQAPAPTLGSPPAPGATAAQGQAPAQAQAQPGRDLPMSRLMADGATVRGGDSSRIILQLGKFVFSCRYGDNKPAICDQIP